MQKKEEKILTQKQVKELGLDKVSVITVDMLDGYTSIGHGAFAYCSSLISVTIPDSVTSIELGAFCYCRSLTSVTIPNSVTSIGVSAFSGCTGLTSIEISDGVINIGVCAFMGCRSLTSVTIPNGVTSIGKGAFSCCGGLASLSVEAGNTVYDSRNNCNAIIETSTNTLIFGCQNTTIPNSVTSIGKEAFWNCSGLTSVTIPNSVTSIGNDAFRYCTGLTSLTIPNSVTRIGQGAFYQCRGLASVTIPDSVTSIGYGAFDYCSCLTSVTIGDKTYEKQAVTNGKCKAYKAFNADMTCRGFQYKEGKTYELNSKPILCEWGFHACLSFVDVFDYYWGEFGKDIVVYEVELEGVSDEHNEYDSKVVAKKITIGKRIL